MTKEHTTNEVHTKIEVTLDKPHGHLEVESNQGLTATVAVYLNGLKTLMHTVRDEALDEDLSMAFLNQLVQPILEEAVQESKERSENKHSANEGTE